MLFFIHFLNIFLQCNCCYFYLDDNTFTWCNTYYAAMYYNQSSMRKVHILRGRLAYVYWIYTVYVQNNLSAGK